MPISNEALPRHLAVIPARGGSKRLPRKNIVDFLGRPILAYTFEAAREAAVFDRILVSTEDAEIAAVAAGVGAEVDNRPDALAGDEATIVDVCLELLGRLERQGERYDTITVLYATAPLRSAHDIRATLGLLEPGRCCFAMAVSVFQQPVPQALREQPGGELTPAFPKWVACRANEVCRFFVGNGSTYSVAVDAFRRQRDFYGSPLRGHVMPRERSVDIDTADDLTLAKYYAEERRLLDARSRPAGVR
jgi:pseudaminic acid cytidylyltransferase